jgi:hypothetical protein
MIKMEKVKKESLKRIERDINEHVKFMLENGPKMSKEDFQRGNELFYNLLKLKHKILYN